MIPDAQRTVLVVDDEPINIQLLQKKLEWDGLRVLTANSGQECLEICKEQKPDLILLDVMMPGMDGFEVCQKLRDEDSTKAIPVIFVTAHNSKQNKLDGLQAGAVDYITKPIDLEETMARVRTQLKFLSINQSNIDLTQRLGEARRSATVGALTQGIAHNLNNLLGVVMGYLELAKVNHQDAEKVLANIARVETAGNRIVAIIKQLSTVAFTNHLPINEITIDKVIDGGINRARENSGFDIHVDVSIDMDSQSIKTNIEAFEDALAKLIINAWESYQDLETDDRPITLTVSLSDDSKNAAFVIRDHGSGIDPKVADHMYEPFISTKSTVGVGMGLTVARHAIRTLGGETQIVPNENAPGVSVRFTHPLEEVL